MLTYTCKDVKRMSHSLQNRGVPEKPKLTVLT